MEYTKGEWKATPNSDVEPMGFTIESPTYLIAETIGGMAYEQQAQNALLIASAPDMYEALKKCVDVFKQLSDEGNYPHMLMQDEGGEGWEFASKALAKAEGK